MATLITVYWLCFGVGLVYVLVAGTLGAVSHGLDAISDIDHDLDIDHDVDHDFDVGLDHDLDVGVDHDFDVGAADFDVGTDFDADHDFDVGIEADVDHDVGVDVGGDSDAAHVAHAGHAAAYAQTFPDWNPFSPLSIAGFLCAFGGAGLLATGLGLNLLLTLAAAFAGGVVMAFLLWFLVGKLLFSMQGTSQAKQADMIGLEAEVLTPVEDDMSGEIAYVLEGVRYTAPARLLREGRIEKREIVRIRKVRGNMVYVAPRKKLLA